MHFADDGEADAIAEIDGVKLYGPESSTLESLFDSHSKDASDQTEECIPNVSYHILTPRLNNFDVFCDTLRSGTLDETKKVVGHSVDRSAFDAIRMRIALSEVFQGTEPVVSVVSDTILMNGGCVVGYNRCHRCHATKEIVLQCPHCASHRMCAFCATSIYGDDAAPADHFKRCAVCDHFCTCAICVRKDSETAEQKKARPKYFSFGETTRHFLVLCPEVAATRVFGPGLAPAEKEEKKEKEEEEKKEEEKKHKHHHHRHHRTRDAGSDAASVGFPAVGIFDKFFGTSDRKRRKKQRLPVDGELPLHIQKLPKLPGDSCAADASKRKTLPRGSSNVTVSIAPSAPSKIPAVVETSDANFSYVGSGLKSPPGCVGIVDNLKWFSMTETARRGVVDIMNVLGVSWHPAYDAYIESSSSVEGAIDLLLPRIKSSAGEPGKDGDRRPPAPVQSSTTRIGIEISTPDLPGCSICLEPFATIQKLTSTDCGHMYCRDCIRGWLKTHSDCPKCRHQTAVSKLRDLYT